MRGASLLLDGEREPAAETDAGGRFSFERVVPDAAPGMAAPVRLVLRARHRGWRLSLPDASPALALELRPGRAADGGARLEVWSSDSALARTVAATLGVPGEVACAVEVQAPASDRSIRRRLRNNRGETDRRSRRCHTGRSVGARKG